MKTARAPGEGSERRRKRAPRSAHLPPPLIFAANDARALEGLSGFRMALSAQVSGEFPQARRLLLQTKDARRANPSLGWWRRPPDSSPCCVPVTEPDARGTLRGGTQHNELIGEGGGRTDQQNDVGAPDPCTSKPHPLSAAQCPAGVSSRRPSNVVCSLEFCAGVSACTKNRPARQL